MIRRYGLFLLTLPVAAAFSAAPALAQNYSSPPPGYYRDAPPPGAYYDDRAAPPAFWSDDDEDDQPVRRPYRSPQMSQAAGQAHARPHPALSGRRPSAAAAGHLPRRPGVRRSTAISSTSRRRPPPNDPNAIRPPGAIGAAGRAAAPAAAAGDRRAAAGGSARSGQPKELPPNLQQANGRRCRTKEPAGTIIVDTAHTYLYLVLGGGKAIRYGVRVGREGFTWTGTERISKMKEWPDWFPPPEMIERQPYLPRVMAGGPGNPLGARAMYLGNTLYRIHGTNQPSTIGHYVSSGCVGMLNEDVEDLYSRVQVGTRVVVLPGKAPETVATTGAGRRRPPTRWRRRSTAARRFPAPRCPPPH